MPNILLYMPPPFKVSGGLGNFKLFFDICKKLGYSIYFCPLLKSIPSLNFSSPFNDMEINNISDVELSNYYLHPDQPSEEIDPKDIVTSTILRARNNVVIYAEDVIGNPAQQEHVVRWLFFFPIPNAVKQYKFNSEYICFFSDYIYNFYKYVCMACGIPDCLTKRIKEKNICRVFKFEPKMYKSIKSNRIINTNMKTNKKCFTIRKLFPPFTFDIINKGFNVDYAREISQIYQKKIEKLINKIEHATNIEAQRKYNSELHALHLFKPNASSYAIVSNYLTEKFTNMGYDKIEHQPSSTIFVDYFLKKDFFISFDPFTFMSIIASLCGCISVVKKIHGLNFDEWVNGDPFCKYGVAYGIDGIEHANKTRHLLLPHIRNMYAQNENNVLNFITNIEKHFNIKIQEK